MMVWNKNDSTEWNEIIDFMKNHPKVFMDLLGEKKKTEIANEAYWDMSIWMNKWYRVKLANLSSWGNNRALSVPK